MKSTEFITEKAVKPYKSSILSVNKAVEMLNAHCRESLALIHTPIWRGMRNHSKPIISIDPTTGVRKSNNTSNYYTELFDNSPYFASWPKRSSSLVCSTGRAYASNYGGGWENGALYTIFPYDGVKIAVCPGKDMWDTPVDLRRLGLSFGENGDNGHMGTFNRIMQDELWLSDSFAKMQQEVKTPAFAKRLTMFINRHASLNEQKTPLQPDEFLGYLQQQMSPANTGFELIDAATFAKRTPHNRECWIGGPVVAIRKDMYEKFLDAVMKDPAAAGNPPNGPSEDNENF